MGPTTPGKSSILVTPATPEGMSPAPETTTSSTWGLNRAIVFLKPGSASGIGEQVLGSSHSGALSPYKNTPQHRSSVHAGLEPVHHLRYPGSHVFLVATVEIGYRRFITLPRSMNSKEACCGTGLARRQNNHQIMAAGKSPDIIILIVESSITHARTPQAESCVTSARSIGSDLSIVVFRFNTGTLPKPCFTISLHACVQNKGSVDPGSPPACLPRLMNSAIAPLPSEPRSRENSFTYNAI